MLLIGAEKSDIAFLLHASALLALVLFKLCGKGI